MSTALYRRYRPETFDEVIGQDHVTGPLKAAIANGRVNHAYLFSGPRGCGKTTSARILARCLNCAQGPTPNPCGVCESCRELATGGPGSLDVVEIDAASHNGVDDARELRERAVYAPARDRFKIFILDEAHMVTPQGFNALLKLVEEPPAHVKFLFATTEPEKVIGTIRSRTHHYPFRLVPPEVLTGYLQSLCEQEGVPVGKGVLPLVVRAGGGSVRDSLSVLDQLMAGASGEGIDYPTAVALLGYTPDSLLGDIVDAFAAGDGAGVFRVVDRVIESGQDPRRFVEDLLERFRDLVVIAAAKESAAAFMPGTPADLLERLVHQAQSFGAGELSRAADLLNAGLTEMTGATSPRLQLELICARIMLPSAEQGRRAVLSRVERLERRTGMSPTGTAGPSPEVHSDSTTAEPAARAAQVPTTQAGSAGSQSSDVQTGASAPVATSSGARSDSVSRSAGTSASTPASSSFDDGLDFDAMADMAAAARSFLDGPDAPANSTATVKSNAPAVPDANADSPSASASPSASSTQDGGSARPEVTPERSAPRPANPTSAAVRAPEPASPASAPTQGTSHQDSPTPRTPVRDDRIQDDPSQGVSTPAAPATPNPAAPAPASSDAGAFGGAELEAIRRSWTEIIDAVGTRDRLARGAMAGNTVAEDFTDGVLYIGFTNEGAFNAFNRRARHDKVSVAIREVLGIEARITCGPTRRPGGVVGGGTGGPTGTGGPAGAGGAPGTSGLPGGGAPGSEGPGPASTVDSGPVSGGRGPGGPTQSGPTSSGPASGGTASGGPRRPTRAEIDSVVGPRQADVPPVDHERFWQDDSAEPATSDDAEGEPAPVQVPQDDSPRVTSPASTDVDPTGTDAATGPDRVSDSVSGPDSEPGTRPVPGSEPMPGTASAPASNPVPATDPVPGADQVPAPETDPSSGIGSASGGPVSPGFDPAAGPMVPAPVDIPEDTAPAYAPSFGDGPVVPAPVDVPEDTDVTAPTGGAEYGGSASATSSMASELDALMGAYADTEIAFTSNEAPTRTPVRDTAPAAPGRRIPSRDGRGSGLEDKLAALVDRHANDDLPPLTEPPEDAYEPEADYDFDSDPEISESHEFGVPVVERILGGEVVDRKEL